VRCRHGTIDLRVVWLTETEVTWRHWESICSPITELRITAEFSSTMWVHSSPWPHSSIYSDVKGFVCSIHAWTFIYQSLTLAVLPLFCPSAELLSKRVVTDRNARRLWGGTYASIGIAVSTFAKKKKKKINAKEWMDEENVGGYCSCRLHLRISEVAPI
jgi:hypothetical protein